MPTTARSGVHRVAALTVLSLAGLLAGKCVDYNTEFETSTWTVAGAEAGTDGDKVPVPAQLCANPDEARLVVGDFMFSPECGCVEEAPGPRDEPVRTCTIQVGTTVAWTFQDATAHNVTSFANTFGASEDLSSGNFQTLFDEPGVYDYSCGIHNNEMQGYSIVVR